MKYSIIFFGSFQEHSVSVLELLNQNHKVLAVITTPAKPQGRHLEVESSPVEIYAKSKNLPVLTPESLDQTPQELGLDQPDFIVVAGYGKLLPSIWLNFPKIAALNIHPSLLPKYKGRFPAEWAILRGETETGVSLINMSEKFDKGEILAQETIPLEDTDTSHNLYKKLFSLAAQMINNSLPFIAENKLQEIPHDSSRKYFYARSLTRDDGFISWETLMEATKGGSLNLQTSPPLIKELVNSHKINIEHWPAVIDRMLRALSPWPGVWTTQPDSKRLKILSGNLDQHPFRFTPTLVQLEGKNPKSWTT